MVQQEARATPAREGEGEGRVSDDDDKGGDT